MPKPKIDAQRSSLSGQPKKIEWQMTGGPDSTGYDPGLSFDGWTTADRLSAELGINSTVDGPIDGVWIVDFTRDHWHEAFESEEYAAFAVCLVAEASCGYCAAVEWDVNIWPIDPGPKSWGLRCTLVNSRQYPNGRLGRH